jgi:hypothetical protein
MIKRITIVFKFLGITINRHELFLSSPTAILIGHKFGLNDVKIHPAKRVVLSYDKAAVLKAWALDTAECLQTVPLHFPR